MLNLSVDFKESCQSLYLLVDYSGPVKIELELTSFSTYTPTVRKFHYSGTGVSEICLYAS